MPTNTHRPSFVDSKQVRAWQPYVDQQIRRQMNQGAAHDDAVAHALDLRDERIKDGDKPPRFGRKKK